ncbi:MAG: YlmC/YmxH family sporulation protein [Eubacteriales bacterium]
MTFLELRKKEVINICNCKNLGHVTNLEFDACTGQICRVIIGGDSSFLNLFSCEPECVVPYKDIKQIGPDIILVEIG